MNLLRAAMTISGFTLISRVTGLVRDVLIASTFGASALTDAFWVAFRIPNLLRRLFAEGAFSQAFVPILGEVKNNGTEDETKSLIDDVASLLFVILLFVSILGVLLSPILLMVMGSGLASDGRGDSVEAAVWMTRIMFPYILCMSLVALASGVLNTWKKFTVPAATPILLNVSMILAALKLSDMFDPPIYALAIGVIAGGVLQLLIQIPALHAIGMLPSIHFNIRAILKNPTVLKIIKKMLPAILGVSVAQISLVINTNIATWLSAGSVSWLSFADRLMEFPTALLGVALGTVLLPSLSKAHAAGQQQAYSGLIDWGLRLILLLGIPAALGLGLMANGLVSVLFHYGSFSASDVVHTQHAVWAYATGLLGLLSIKILAPGFYAKQDLTTPVVIAVVILVLTQLMNLVFVPLMGHVGLALSIGIASCLNALALLRGLIKRGIFQPQTGWFPFLVKLSLAVGVMGIFLYGSNHYIDWIELQAHRWGRIGLLFAIITIAVILYFGVLRLLGIDVRHFRRAPTLD